jgi:hypothetical protein
MVRSRGFRGARAVKVATPAKVATASKQVSLFHYDPPVAFAAIFRNVEKRSLTLLFNRPDGARAPSKAVTQQLHVSDGHLWKLL